MGKKRAIAFLLNQDYEIPAQLNSSDELADYVIGIINRPSPPPTQDYYHSLRLQLRRESKRERLMKKKSIILATGLTKYILKQII